MLKEAAAELGDATGTCRVVESNDPGSAIVASVGDDALLCMASHGRTGVARMLGSTAEAVVRASSRPVLLLGPRASVPADWGVVQVCVDTAWLVEVQPARRVPVDTDAIESGGLEAMAMHLRGDGIDVEWEVFHGDDVAGELLRARASLGASMLVVTTHARAGLARAVLGSVTTDLVHGSPCPVLVVPPAHIPV
jgi:nucleotide-binding universal stress UspA family protein